MKAISIYKEYCTGCGLCATDRKKILKEDEKGYLVPNLNESDAAFCSIICPAGGNALKNYQDGTIWGSFKYAFLGWSTDDKIRKSSSSGGILTTLCCYLLDNKIVDGIIQTRKSECDIRKTETVVSRTKAEVLTCMGSRYSSSNPLLNLSELVQKGGLFAFVGKPCDVSALRIYMEEVNPQLKKQVKYLFSFFCAGQPSILANSNLVKALGGDNPKEWLDLQYRGNGWPGYATLTKKDGSRKQMDYETSWMKILGRDVRKICRFCADGTGELADISCGDAWYVNANGKPDFAERLGRNVIFARTEAGSSLLNEVIKAGCIEATAFESDIKILHQMQPYHYTRKASLLVYKYALKFCGRAYPNYDCNKLRQFARGFSYKQIILRFCGTIMRVLRGKI